MERTLRPMQLFVLIATSHLSELSTVACVSRLNAVWQVRPDEVLFMYGGSYRPKGNRMQLIKVDRERRAAWPIPISARHLPGALVFLMA